jgi:MFS transporter, DHA1 family, multidrug resistance protein
MWDIIRDSSFGQCLRIISGRRLAKYPEEYAAFELPAGYLESCSRVDFHSTSAESNTATEVALEENDDQTGATVIGWYSDGDPENPHNWSFRKKLWVAIMLFIYTFSVYIGSSLYTASEPDIRNIFGVSDTLASLGLTLYVIAYGVGPMIFSPLSEIPAVGRTSPYMVTYFIFVILCIPMALVNNLAGILVLRTLLGFFGSPCLATAGASYGDFYGANEMPYVIAMWGGGATLGPV